MILTACMVVDNTMHVHPVAGGHTHRFIVNVDTCCRHMKLVLFGLYTWWIPQIVLSAVLGGRQPLKPVYIIGTSAARLVLPLYLYGCPANLLRIPPAPRMLVALVASVAAQVFCPRH
jgi:hypothetical protein